MCECHCGSVKKCKECEHGLRSGTGTHRTQDIRKTLGRCGSFKKKVCQLMHRSDGGRFELRGLGRCEVSIFRIHLGGVTVIGKVFKSSRRCWVEKEVLISQ